MIAIRQTEPALTDPDWTGTDPAVDPDRCVTFRRGPLLVVVNLGRVPAERRVPVGSEVLTAWRPVPTPDGSGPIRLSPESAAVLRTGSRR
ncbi:DUF3459 domain-containing protein [Streptomyces sp. NPDC021100]|uniref:DUF3459 domain-containing protein n=1 Tax=Streptomyces sp. NPDC021100 TaxID=3365114 RepID=UPI003788A2EA